MNISDQPSPYDDTEAHAISFRKADAERAEGEDTEGHLISAGKADAERAEDDDTEAHGLRGP